MQPLWKKIWRLLKNLKIDLPYDPAILLLRIYPNECDTGYSRGTCTPMFIAALFTMAKLWKQPRCPKCSYTHRLRRPKIVCSPSYANFRANTAMLLDLGHMTRGEHIREVWG
jgi:hypothetical protein